MQDGNVEGSLQPTQKETLESAPNGKGSRLEKIEQRIAQLENQKKAILAREKEKARKERTRRLIQIGAISLKYFGLPDGITPEEYEKVARKIVTALEQKLLNTCKSPFMKSIDKSL